MKLANPMRRVLPSQRSVGHCSSCQAVLWEGMVANAEGGMSCLACSILRCLGLQELRPAAPLSTESFSLPRRADRIPGLTG